MELALLQKLCVHDRGRVYTATTCRGEVVTRC